MTAFGKEGVDGVKEADYKWGEEKSKDNYKSVSISGEVYDVGHCVQCNLESKEAYIWKILKLFQGDKKMCRIRRLFREVDLPQNVKGLDPLAEVNELFLASQGIDMQEDIPLEKIARKSKIFCTFQDDNGMNTIPSSEQIKDADYFFYRGYDPANEEVIALDDVVDELGAQYVYNKNWWFGDKVGRPSSSQISGGRIPSQSHASGSSAHKVTAKGMYPFVLETSPAPSRDSTEQKLKKRKSDNVALEQEKDVSKSNKYHALKKPKVDKSIISHSDHIIYAIPAPTFTDSLQGSNVLLKSAKPPNSTLKLSQQEGKGDLVNGIGVPIDLVGLKHGETESGVDEGLKHVETESGLDEGLKHVETESGVDEDRKNDSKEALQKIAKHGKKSNAPNASSLSLKLAPKNNGRGSNKRSRKVGEKLNKGSIKRSLKLPKNKPIASSRNISKLPKRASQDIGLTTPLFKNTKNLHVEIPTCTENPTPTDKNILSENPRALKEVVKTDVISKVLKGDEDAPNAPTSSQQQSISPSLNMLIKKGDGSSGKEPSPYKSPLSTLKTRMSDIDIDDILEIPLTASPQQTSERRIFKRIEDWDATLPSAVQSQRVLLLKNVDPELHSEDFSEALTQSLKVRCEVRIAPPVSFSYRTTTALVKLPSVKKAQEFLEKTKSSHLLVADRVVTVTTFTSDDLRAPPLKHYGHLDFSQTLRDQHVDDYKNAVATSHLAQGNTIEFAYGLPWRVLDEQHEDQWRLLQEAHSQDRTDIGSVSRKKQ